jgi:hypothetical protein
VKQIAFLTALFAAMVIYAAPAIAQAETREVYPGPIDVNKMDPARRALSPYSFYVPPYNLYYFHHIDKLNIQQDWIRRSGPGFALRESSAPFSASYTYANQQHTLDEYFARNYVVGFVVLHDNQILLGEIFSRGRSGVAVSLKFGLQVVHLGSDWGSHSRGQNQECG